MAILIASKTTIHIHCLNFFFFVRFTLKRHYRLTTFSSATLVQHTRSRLSIKVHILKLHTCITFQLTAAETVNEFCNESDLDTRLLPDLSSTAAETVNEFCNASDPGTRLLPDLSSTAAETVNEFCNESNPGTRLLPDLSSTAALETNACVLKPEEESDYVAVSAFNSDMFEEEAVETGIH